MSEQTKHTKGPWTYEYVNWLGEAVAYRPYVSGDRFVDGDTACRTGVCIVEGNATSLGVTEANARLIAASPDLLEGVKDALRELDLLRQKDTGTVYDVTLRVRLRELIARAEGK